MPNIQSYEIVQDIQDRLDTFVQLGEMSDQIRNKITTETRLIQAINQAQLKFVRKFDPVVLANFQSDVTPTADATDSNLSRYAWPSEAFTERNDLGLVRVKLGSREFMPEESIPISSLRSRVTNLFYGADAYAFHLDVDRQQIYIPSGQTVGFTIIKPPTPIDSISQGSGVTELKIDDRFDTSIVAWAVEHLLTMLGASNRETTNEEN